MDRREFIHNLAVTTAAASYLVPKSIADTHRASGAEIDSGIPLHLGSNIADHSSESADQRTARALGDRNGQAELATHRRHLGADESGADDENSPRLRCQCGLQPARITGCSQREDALERSLLRVEPGSRARTGGDEQAIERHLLAIGQAHLLGGPVEAGGGDAKAPLRIQFA